MVLYGTPEDVQRLLGELRAVAPGRDTQSTQVWVRVNAITTVNKALTSHQMAIVHGPGDIDRTRVCCLSSPCALNWWSHLRHSPPRFGILARSMSHFPRCVAYAQLRICAIRSKVFLCMQMCGFIVCQIHGSL